VDQDDPSWYVPFEVAVKESVHEVPSVDNNNTFVVAEGVTFQELQQQQIVFIRKIQKSWNRTVK